MTHDGSAGTGDESASETVISSVADRRCRTCGTPFDVLQRYCGVCGSRLDNEQKPHDSAGRGPSDAWPDSGADEPGIHQQPTPAEPAIGDSPFGVGATIGAVALSLFLPLIALIVALAMRSQERRPSRRRFLKNWAIGSAVWLCTGWLIPLVAFSAASPVVSGCQGGIDQAVPPSYQSSDGTHWQATYTCMNGGTVTRSVPASQVPGGG